MGEIKKVETVKVGIIDEEDRILTLRRSQTERSGRGARDWGGGKLRPGESLFDAMFREITLEELMGTELHNVTPIHVTSKLRDGIFRVDYLLAATATHPEDGPSLSEEHDSFSWVPRSEYHDLNIAKRFKIAVEQGAPVFDRLVELATQRDLVVVNS